MFIYCFLMTTKVPTFIDEFVESHSTSMLLYFVMVIQCAVCILRDCVIFFFLSHLLVIYSYWRIKYTALKFVSENWKEKGTLGGDPNILSSGFVNFVSSAILHIKNVFAILRPFNQSHKVYSPFAPSKKKSFQNEKKVRIKISFVQSELQFLKKTVYFMSACHSSYCH